MSTNLKTKKENWTGEEVDVLLEEVEKRKSFLFGKLSAYLTNERKKAQWREVVSAINAVSRTKRTESEAVKKWRTIKSKTKSKEGVRQQELKQTGGGESAVPCDPSPLEQRVLGIIGQVSVRGIPGGVDSGATEAGNSEDVEDEEEAHNLLCKRRSVVNEVRVSYHQLRYPTRYPQTVTRQ